VTEDLNEMVRAKAPELGMTQSGLYAAAVRENLSGPAGRWVARSAQTGRISEVRSARAGTRKPRSKARA